MSYQRYRQGARIAAALSLSLFVASGATFTDAAAQDDPGDALAGLADDLRAEYDLPGLIVAFRQGGHPAHVLASGATRADGGARLRGDEAMHMGSVSKPLASTVIADLVADGRLAWDTRLFDVFPELAGDARPEYRDATVWDLLTHEARFTPYTDDSEIDAAPRFSGTSRQMRAAFLAWAVTQPPQDVPEDDEPYSNAGYAALAAMAERATGESFEDLVKARLFDRLGLTRAGFGWPAKTDESAPWGHRFRDGAFRAHAPDDAYQLGPVFAAAGDMHMSVPDLMAVAAAHLTALKNEDGAYDAAAIQKLHTVTETGYGGGWYVRPTGHYHTGSAETFFAFVLVSPARDVVIAAATNGSNAEEEFSVAGKIIGRVYHAYGVRDLNDEDGAPAAPE